MATQLKNIVAFTAVGAGASSTIAHDLNIDGVGQVPDKAELDNADFEITAVDATNVSVLNTSGSSGSVNVLVEHWYSSERVFGGSGTTALSPRPFIPTGGVGASATPETTFVYRPGGVAGGNVYTDWATIVAALTTVKGRKFLEFDNSIVSPVSIPAGGPYEMLDVVWTSIPPALGISVFVEVADGASFDNLRNIHGFAPFGTFQINNLATVTSPVADFRAEDAVNLENVLFTQGGAAAFFSGNLPAGQVNFYLHNTNFASGISVIDFPNAGTTLSLNLWNGVEILGDSLGVGVAAALELIYWGAPLPINRTQTGILGSRFESVGNMNRLDINPDPPSAPLTANPKGDLFANNVYRINGTAAAAYVLPTAASTRGLSVIAKDVVGGAAASVAAAGGDTIEGGASVPIPASGAVHAISDGSSDWMVI